MKKLIALLLALTMLLTMGIASADKLADIQAAGKLVVGANVLFPPYEFYYTNEAGEEVAGGFDMQLARGIAEYLGVEFVLADQDFSGLITALRNGELDCIISGLSMKPERVEVVDFSDPYYVGTQIMLVRKEDVEVLTTVADMDGKKIGAQTGSLQQGILEEQFTNAIENIQDKIPLMILDLINGEIDGLLITDTVAKQYMAVYPDTMAISSVPVVYDNTIGIGVAVEKGDNETLLAKINEYIAQVKADGTFDAWVDEAMTLSASTVQKD